MATLTSTRSWPLRTSSLPMCAPLIPKYVVRTSEPAKCAVVRSAIDVSCFHFSEIFEHLRRFFMPDFSRYVALRATPQLSKSRNPFKEVFGRRPKSSRPALRDGKALRKIEEVVGFPGGAASIAAAPRRTTWPKIALILAARFRPADKLRAMTQRRKESRSREEWEMMGMRRGLRGCQIYGGSGNRRTETEEMKNRAKRSLPIA